MLGYYMGLSSPPLAKVVAQLGYDLVWIDWEHASTNVETMTQVSKTISQHLAKNSNCTRWSTMSNSSVKEEATLLFGKN